MLKKYFLAKLFIPLFKRIVSLQLQAIFGKLNFIGRFNRRGPYYLKLCKEDIFWLNYLFLSSKEVFLHNFRQFLENWIFEGNSTGANLTKIVKILYFGKLCWKIFFGLIIYSFHQKKCFSTILGNFWKIVFLTEIWQARTLQK